MKKLNVLIILVLSLGLVRCSKSDKGYPQVGFYGVASEYKSNQVPMFSGGHVIENSMVERNGEVVSYYDLGYDKGPHGDFDMASLGQDGTQFKNAALLDTNMRFSYVFKYQNVYYAFYELHNDIYLKYSSDGLIWNVSNGGQAVLTHEDNTPFANLWNVSVDVDDNGLWHMFIECSPSAIQDSQVGLCYATATMNSDYINFNLGKTANQVILHGGNPFVKYIDGKGLLLIYGTVFNPKDAFDWHWYITAATVVDGTIHEASNFQIGAVGVHICDPHAIDMPNGNGSMITFSVDQNYTYSANSNLTLSQIFDLIN